MNFEIGDVYSFDKIAKDTFITYKLNNGFYLRYELCVENAVYLGDLGHRGYGENMISFLWDNKILSIFPSFIKNLHITKITENE